MPSNEEIAERMDRLMLYYRGENDALLASAFNKAGTKIRQLDERVEEMSKDRLNEFTNFDKHAIEKIREHVETGKIKELEG